MFAGDKHSSLLGHFVSYKENEVLLIRPWFLQHPSFLCYSCEQCITECSFSNVD